MSIKQFCLAYKSSWGADTGCGSGQGSCPTPGCPSWSSLVPRRTPFSRLCCKPRGRSRMHGWLLVQIHLFIAVSVEIAGGSSPSWGACGCSFKQAVAAQAWLVQGLDAHAEVAQGGWCCQDCNSRSRLKSLRKAIPSTSSLARESGQALPLQNSPTQFCFALAKCRQQARQRGKRCRNSQLVVPGVWCKTRGFQDSEHGRSPPPAAFCPAREREVCACLATCEGRDLASVLSGAECGAAGSQPADTAAGMHAGCVTGTIPKQAVLSSTCAWGHVTGVRPLTAGCAAAGEAGMCRQGIAPR